MTYYNRDYWEDMYGCDIAALPWEIPEPPTEIRDYISTHPGSGGKALDAGCGTGNFSLYLAKNGYDVSGIDYSEKAITVAQERAQEQRLDTTFVRGDLTELTNLLPSDSFKLILDYKVSHHLKDEQLLAYAEQCYALLKSGGHILLVCYSEKDTDAAGNRSAIGKYGNEMFYRTREQIVKFFHAFQVHDYKEVMLGKRLNHAGHCLVFEKP
ncbi:MAG TPA: class I SAM-dependent methyltransferase [Candidatus Saccharimonadales bacterium]|nr:class I SAM-dependent methyltransferase [Candidatus Saccharimonadales bacterium]